MLPVAMNAQSIGAAMLTGTLTESAAKKLLAEAGIPILHERVARTAAEAINAGAEIGFPVVLKIDSPDIAHKTEVGGVVLDLRDAAQVRAAFDAIVLRAQAAMPAARINGVLVAPMIREGIEAILGVNIDPTFGPMVMFGLGGVGVELYKDVAFASAPLTPRRAEALINAIRGRAVLAGWRGKPPVKRAVLIDALCRLAEFAMRHETTLQSVEINPFVVTDRGGFALDALIVTR
jgi:succinyl-CoA synthetase beta subunit